MTTPLERGAPPSRPGVALALATLAFAVCFAAWGLIAPLAPMFRQTYHLTNVQVGLLVATPVLLGSLARIPLGVLTDRYGGRLVFTLLMLVVVVPLGLAGLTRSYAALLGVSLLLGLAGASFAVGVPFVAGWFPPARQGFALGVYGMGNIGTAAASMLAPRVAGGAGWPVVFWGGVPLMLAMAAVFWLFARDARPAGAAQAASWGSRLAVFRRPVALVLSLFYFVTFGGFVAIGAYLPTLLVDAYGLTRGSAGARTAGFIVMATLARPIGGYLADRVGGTPILNAGFLVIAAAAVVLAFQPGMPMLTVAFLTIALMLGLGNGAVFKLVAEHFPGETGTVTGMVGAAGGLGGFFPPLVMGFVRDATGSYAIDFMLLSEFALLCLIINLLALQRGAWIIMGAPSTTID